MNTKVKKPKAPVFGDPKPTAKAHWKKSLRAARLYADACCREYVKAKYHRCVTCPSTFDLEWAHVLSGKGDAVRWEPIGMARQCSPCNQLHELDPEPLTTWFLRTYGQPAFNALVMQSNTAVKFTYDEIMAKGDAVWALLNGGAK